jgi:hypothetical protein
MKHHHHSIPCSSLSEATQIYFPVIQPLIKAFQSRQQQHHLFMESHGTLGLTITQENLKRFLKDGPARCPGGGGC